jgi:hypothetical protein
VVRRLAPLLAGGLGAAILLRSGPVEPADGAAAARAEAAVVVGAGWEAPPVGPRLAGGGRPKTTTAEAAPDETPAPATEPAPIPTAGEVVDAETGVQRIDPYVDARGRRTLRALEPGVVTVEAAWASRRGTASRSGRTAGTLTANAGTRTGRGNVVVEDGSTASVRIVVDRHR